MVNELFDYRLNFIKNTVKNNKGVIFILPTVLGSVMQILSLLSVDYNISYLKFFSLSQIVPDSLYFLLSILITILIDLVLMYFFGKFILKKKSLNKRISLHVILENEKKNRTIFFCLIILFALVTSAFDFVFHIISDIKTDPILNKLPKLYIALIYIFINLIPGTYLYLVVGRMSERKFFNVGFGLMFFTGFLILFKNFYKNSSEMTNNANFLYTNELVKNNLNADTVNMIYFNDKYIFYNIYYGETNEIYIYKLENILY